MKLTELARVLGLEVGGVVASEIEITGVGGLADARTGQLTYTAEAKHVQALATTQASAAICRPEHAGESPIPCLISKSPGADFARATRVFHPRRRLPTGIHETAVVAPSAIVSNEAHVGAFVVVGDHVTVGDGSEIHARTVLYDCVEVGRDTVIQAGCIVREGTKIGDRCVLQPGVVVGSDGFGFARDADGHYEKIEQLGVVVIEDDVEIGAGSTIDRATFGETRIRTGAKIDNLVQIGHNVVVGENTILCAQVGLAGSTTVGRGVTLAGQVGVAGHCEIGDGVVATAQTGIPSSVSAGKLVSGYPAIDNRSWLKSSAVFNRLPELQKSVRRLERAMSLEKSAIDEP
ncbi:MAG: UDP-3-O-(3-hydroxymyristoyl)glucosamine N-acyltransferase [Acidobacteria bacterium]|nr:UDP-3-O-(3-hydroxymyristoyl)glucosamine N-acyltransferase [Acidobacteriota bacterium]